MSKYIHEIGHYRLTPDTDFHIISGFYFRDVLLWIREIVRVEGEGAPIATI